MGAIILVCGNVFDGISDSLTGPAEILVEGNQIARVERSVGRPPGARVISLRPNREPRLQRSGPRKPMIEGCLITGLSIILLMPTNLMLANYKLLAIIGYTLCGIGLAFYATPSTDAALSSLPASQVGSGAGIYKLASSLGAAFGVAISGSIFSALSANPAAINWLEGVITFEGRQDNLAVREAAIIALSLNVLMVLVATISIVLTVPNGKKTA